jgi:hypothetical protein
MADSPEMEGGSDIDAGVSDIAEGLFDESPDTQNDDHDYDDAAPVAEKDEVTAAPEQPEEPAAEAPVARSAPQSWAKDKHEVWSKMAPEAQDYYLAREKQMLDGLEQYKEHSSFGKQLRDVFTPYKALLQAQGVDEAKAAQYMLNAHYKLSSGSAQERATFLSSLAKSYNIDLTGLPQQEQQQVDPTVKALQDKVGTLEQTLTQRQQEEQNQQRQKISATVDAFASDPKNIYFEECADDIAAFLRAGHTLEQAYDKAVYANPVTRAKEIARLQTESEKALREKSGKDVEAARKATAVNVRGRDTRRAPTEAKGTMDDTLNATLKSIMERVH